MSSVGNIQSPMSLLSRRLFLGGAVAFPFIDIPHRSDAMTAQSPIGTNGLPVSIASLGNISKLQSALRRAQSGLPINVGFLGGSITAGYNSTSPAKRWSSLTVSQINAIYGKVATEVNCGIGGTNSDYGALRVDRDVINRGLHIFVLEYAVNDTISQRPSYESIIRRVQAACPGVAIIAMMACDCNLRNVQDVLVPVCQNYDITVVSYRDLAQALIASGAITLAQITSPDGVHPPDMGHAIAAQAMMDLIGYAKSLNDAKPPLYPNDFDKTGFISNDGLNAVSKSGFVYAPDPGDIPIENVGALISNAVWDWFSTDIVVGGSGKVWLMLAQGNDGKTGTLLTQIDGVNTNVSINNDPSFPSSAQKLILVASGVAPGRHTVKVTNWPNPNNRPGNFNWVCGIGYTI